jgi:hypothetical protein
MDNKNLKEGKRPYLIKITEPETLPGESGEMYFNGKYFESIQRDFNFSQYSEERKKRKDLETVPGNKVESNEYTERRYKNNQTLSPHFSDVNDRGNSRKLKLDPKLQKALDTQVPEKIINSSCSCLIF